VFHLSFEASVKKIRLRTHTGPAQSKAKAGGLLSRRAGNSQINRRWCGLRQLHLLGGKLHQQPFHTQRKTNSRRGRASDSRNQAVVTSAAAYCALCTDIFRDKLKNRPRVVIQATHDLAIDDIVQAETVQIGAKPLEMLLAI